MEENALLGTRCVELMLETGCEQFEVFRSVIDPVSQTRTPIPRTMINGMSVGEDCTYNRTR